MFGSFLLNGFQALKLLRSLMSGKIFSGDAFTLALRCTRKLSGRVEAAIRTPPTSTAATRAMSLSMALFALFLFGDLRAQALFLLAQLGRELRTEVLRLEHLADLDLGLPRHGVGAALHPLDRLLLRLDLPDPESGDELLRLRERAVDHAALRAGEPHARAFRARMKSLAGEHDAGFHQLFVELAHLREQFLARHDARLGVLGGLDQDHEFHRDLL